MTPEGVWLKDLWDRGLGTMQPAHCAFLSPPPPPPSWRGQIGTQVAQLSAG